MKYLENTKIQESLYLIKLNELCSEHGIPAEEVCLYIFMFVMLRTEFSYIHSLE